MNKTKNRMKHTKNKNKSKSKKIKGGGLFNSFGSFFKSNVSPTFKDIFKLKTISDDIQKVYDANNKDEPTFNAALTGLKGKLSKLSELIPKIESEKKTEHDNKSTKNPLLGNSTNPNARPTNGRVNPMNRMNPRTNRGIGAANAVAAGAGAAGALAAGVEAKKAIFGSN